MAKSDKGGRFQLILLAFFDTMKLLWTIVYRLCRRSHFFQVLELSHSQFLSGLANHNPNLIKFSQIISKLGPGSRLVRTAGKT